MIKNNDPFAFSQVRPKLGKIDIDYQKLHDAFFKWQTKPKMTLHGDLYYEGKEFEIRLKEKKPGDLSDDLRTALGMPVGPNAHKVDQMGPFLKLSRSVVLNLHIFFSASKVLSFGFDLTSL